MSRPAGTFTPKQGQYLAFIYAYTRINRRPPAQADMRSYFRVSPPSVHQMLLTLEREGLIKRQPGMPALLNCSLIRNACRSYADPSGNQSKSLCRATSCR